MGLFSNIKEAYEQNEKKRSATLINAEYMGGYDGHKKALGNLSFLEQKIEFKVALNNHASFNIPISDVINIEIEGKDQVSRRVTVTRLIAIGIFAFALQKKREDKDGYITLELSGGQEVIFHIKNKSPTELRVTMSNVILSIKQKKA